MTLLQPMLDDLKFDAERHHPDGRRGDRQQDQERRFGGVQAAALGLKFSPSPLAE